MPSAAELSEDYEAIVASNWYSNFGPYERRFVSALEAFIPGSAAVTMANATIALIGVLHVVLGRGDGTRYVIVPSFTFAAGPAAIEWCGYRPLFIDIEPEGLQPDLEQAKTAVSTRRDIAGVLLANSFGIGNHQIGEWESFAAEAGLPLLVDSAAGFGSRYADGQLLGMAGAAEVFSLHVTKPFGVGEGAVITTSDRDLADRLNGFQNFGFLHGREALDLGLNGKLTEISAAIGLRQLARLESAVASRQTVLAAYAEALPSGWRLPTGIERSSLCFASLVAPDEAAREAAHARLTAAGVEVRRYYAPAVHRQEYFRMVDAVAQLSVTDDITTRVLSLPVHEQMPAEHVARVIAALVG